MVTKMTVLIYLTMRDGLGKQSAKDAGFCQSLSTTRLAIDIIRLIQMAILLQKYIQLSNFYEHFLVLKE